MNLLDCLRADSITYKGKEFQLYITFKNVIKLFQLLEDDLFNQVEKVSIASRMLIKNEEDLESLTLFERSELVNKILETFILEKKKKKQEESNNHDDVFDLFEDFDYIYASFLFDYGIDLLDQDIHWRKFKALLAGLSDNSKFKQVIAIRTAKIPAPNKHNAEERQRLIELKQIYSLKKALPSKEEMGRILDAKFDSLAQNFRRRKGGY